MANRQRAFTSSEGPRRHYGDWGNETAPPLILIHGGLDHCRNWDAIAEPVAAAFPYHGARLCAGTAILTGRRK